MKTDKLAHEITNYFELDQNSKADLLHDEISRDPNHPVNILNYPYNCIGLLKFTNPTRNLTLNGTAFLIDCDLIVTSAANIYSKQNECYYKDFLFYPSNFDKNNPPIKIREFRMEETFKEKESQEESYDHCLALMKLDRPVYCTRYCQIKYDYFWEQGAVEMYGYPKPMAGVKLFGKQGKIIKMKENLITHSIVSEPGQVGSPIFVRNQLYCCVIGIHIGCQDHNGVGLLLTKDLMMKLCRWERQMVASKIMFASFDKEGEEFKPEAYTFYFNSDSVITDPAISSWYPLQLEWQIGAQNAKRFYIKNQRIIRTHCSMFDDRHRQVISERPLPSEGKHVVTFKVVKYGTAAPYDSIYFGIITPKHKIKDYSDGRSKGSLAYLTCPDNFSDAKNVGKGTVLMDGIQIAYGSQLFIEEGGELKMEFNMISKQVTWNNGKKTVSVRLSSTYLNKALNMFVSMCSNQSCVAWRAKDDHVWP